MRHTRFVSRLLNRPQLITPAAGAAVVAALMPNSRLFGYDDGPADAAQPSGRDYQVIGATAIIPVVGELVHRGASMDAMSGLTSYQALGDMVTDALADPGVDALVFDLDSPGGEADGCLDFAEWLAGQRGSKALVASINQQACSAAYAIASACDWIGIGQDASAGSIGVVGYHTDVSQALDKAGVTVTYLYAGAHKIDGAPGLPLSDQARTAWQSKIDTLYSRFCSVVAANRGLSQSAVQDTEAAIFLGPDAVSAGLADAIATPGDILMSLASTARIAPISGRLAAAAKGPKLALTEEGAQPPVADPVLPPVAPEPPAAAPVPGVPGALPADVPDDQHRPNAPASPGPAVEVAQACTKAGHAGLIAGLLESGASMATVRTRIADADGIQDACIKAGVPGMATSLVASGIGLDAARTVIFDAAAGRSDAVRTDTANSGAKPDAPKAVAAGPIYARINARSAPGRTTA